MGIKMNMYNLQIGVYKWKEQMMNCLAYRYDVDLRALLFFYFLVIFHYEP